MLAAGAHIGHLASRWHPKMAINIHSRRGGVHIIDLTKTDEALSKALSFIESTVATGRPILLVGTKKQAKPVVLALAEATGMPHVVNRWLGGLLTNHATISSRIKYLKDQEVKLESGSLEASYSKLEIQRFSEEIDRLNFLYGGIKDMSGNPAALIVFDILEDETAVKEARKLKIPVIGLVDSNGDPSSIEYPIPANDDAIKTLELMADYFRQAIVLGQAAAAKAAQKTNPATTTADQKDKASDSPAVTAAALKKADHTQTVNLTA